MFDTGASLSESRSALLLPCPTCQKIYSSEFEVQQCVERDLARTRNRGVEEFENDHFSEEIYEEDGVIASDQVDFKGTTTKTMAEERAWPSSAKKGIHGSSRKHGVSSPSTISAFAGVSGVGVSSREEESVGDVGDSRSSFDHEEFTCPVCKRETFSGTSRDVLFALNSHINECLVR